MTNKHKQFDFRTAYIDLLLNVLTAILVISIISFALIAKKNQDGIEKKAEFIANVTWDKNVDCDVDIWVRNPLNKVVSFQSKDNGVMNIERDDLGFTNDNVQTRDGKVVTSYADNSETWVLRGIVPGEYTFNVHLYGCKRNAVSVGHGAPFDLDVSVSLYRVNPRYTELISRTKHFTSIWEEITMFSVDINGDRSVSNIDERPVELVKVEGRDAASHNGTGSRGAAAGSSTGH
jgi:hypothetical protein